MTVQLERIEWCEFRWDEADKTDMPRVLLIGDSITKGYRPHVAEEFKGIASIDLMASSRGLDNPAFARELRYVTVESGYNYRVIQFNNGLHGFHSSAEAYEAGLDRVLTALMKLREDGGAKIVLALSTPVTRKQEAGILHPELNALVLERNEVMKRLAERNALPVNDLYEPMLGHPEYRLPDGFHYNDDGKKAQAAIVAADLGKYLG